MELELSREEQRARRFGRVPLDAPVRLTRHSTGQVLELSGVNLSENGLFVETVIPFAVGEVFRLSFGEGPIEGGARVTGAAGSARGAIEGGARVTGAAGSARGAIEVAAARVAWRRPFVQPRSAASPPGIGLMFLLMHPVDRQALKELVDEGGIAPSARPRAIPSRTAPTVVHGDPPPQMRWVPGGEVEMLEVGPVGWLLALALAMAAVASLLVGLHPIPV